MIAQYIESLLFGTLHYHTPHVHGLTGTDSSSVCTGAVDELLTLFSLAFGDGLNYTDKKQN